MRLASIICLLRTACTDQISNTVTKQDVVMAKKIADSSVSTAFALLENENQSSATKKGPLRQPPLPEADQLTMEYLLPYHNKVRKIVKEDKIPMSAITRDKIYPVVNNQSGSLIASKFVKGLESLGFGKYSPNSKSFKRFSPGDDDCPDREKLIQKYRLLNIEYATNNE